MVKKKKILIVDDEPEICEVLAQCLRRKGFATEKAYNGLEAQEMIGKIKPDLIILDVLMPKMGGFEFLQYLKSHSSFCKIPVVMLTARAEPRNVDKGIFLGADFYLPKPCTLQNLMQFIDVTIT